MSSDRIIYRYEVELRLFYSDGRTETRTFIQNAYSVNDAVFQSIHVLPNSQLDKVETIRVGPPIEDIGKQAQSFYTKSIASCGTRDGRR